MKLKYVPPLKHGSPDNYGGRIGRKPNANMWTDERLLQREKYYAFIKHRAQCNYRGEDFFLTETDWLSMWTDELFKQRGRKSESLCIYRVDPEKPWQADNIDINTRRFVIRHHKCQNKEDVRP